MIVRTPNRERYVVLSTVPLEDSRLTWKARGILAYLLSKPDGWEVHTAQLVNAGPGGRDGVRAALRELDACGYITRVSKRGANNLFDDLDVYVHEEPVPQTAFPAPENQGPENQGLETRPLVITDVAKTELETHSETRPPKDWTAQLQTDVDELCEYLVLRIAKHHGTDPLLITPRWRDDMRKLIQRGSPEHKPKSVAADVVRRGIDYTFDHLNEKGRDGFCWADVIRSPGNLRRHWAQLVEARLRQMVRAKPSDARAPWEN